MYRHQRYYCKSRKRDEEIKSLREENREMKKQIDVLHDLFRQSNEDKKINIHNINSNNTTNIITNNTTNNITIVAYGSENYKNIPKNVMYKIFKRKFNSVEELINYIHFNEDKPENHNIYISNMRDKHVHVFDDTRWSLEKSKETIEEMIDEKNMILGDIYCDYDNDLKNKLGHERAKRILRDFKNYHDKIYTDEHGVLYKDNMFDKIKKNLYNLIDIPIKTRNKQKKTIRKWRYITINFIQQ